MNRLVLISAAFIVLLTPALDASLISVNFSGTWGQDAGMIHAGDPFSGTAVWDDGGVSTSAFTSIDLYSFTLSLIPGEIVSGEGAGWHNTDSLQYEVQDPFYWHGDLESLRLTVGQTSRNLAASCDGSNADRIAYFPQYYLRITPTGVAAYCSQGFGNAQASAFSGTYSYNASSPVLVAHNPEPSTFWMVGLVLGSVILIKRRLPQ